MEEIQIKQRLVGAIILVLLAVIFLPMIFDGEGYEAYLDDQVPPVPPALLEPTGIVPGSALDAGETGGKRLAPSSLQKGEERASANKESGLVEKNQSEQKNRTAESSAAKGEWVVQVASFSQRQNAQRFRDELQKGGFTAYIESITVKNKPGYRVIAGPFKTKNEAMQGQQQIQNKFSTQGLVRELKD